VLIFGLTHAAQVLVGNPIDDTLMTTLNCFISGLWWGPLVLRGGSIWPAVLIHAVSNASVQIVAASLTGFDSTVADYAVATAAELPLVIAGLWLLPRRVPGSIPNRSREWGAEVSLDCEQLLQGIDAQMEATTKQIEKQGAK
jgi:membrane protease YdiL (CAAX protease family)